MSTKSIHIEITLLILLSTLSWPNTSNPGHNCPPENSNVVRKIIQRKFIPILDRYKATLPIECPFHASRDLYGRRREGPELEGNPPSLVCWICGLTYGSAKELRHHYQAEHSNSLALQEGAVCLADYCAIMRCNVLMANEWLASLNGTSSDQEKQQQTTSRQTIEWEGNTEAGRLAAKQTLKAREEARRGECNSTELLELQTKCQKIVRSCISGLILSLSPKDFQEIEEDMNRAVCSFLTCEKFWEDSLVEEPRYPLGFFFAILTMLSIGMIICYYIVWVVFDSGETYGREECYEVYVLYSGHLTEAKAPRKCDIRRRMVQSCGHQDIGMCDENRIGHPKKVKHKNTLVVMTLAMMAIVSTIISTFLILKNNGTSKQ